MNVFTDNLDWFNASLLNKSFNFFNSQKSYSPQTFIYKYAPAILHAHIFSFYR